MYKDKDKQREANRAAAKRQRDKKVGIMPKNVCQDAPGLTNSVIPDIIIPPKVIPVIPSTVIPNLELCRYCSQPLPKLDKPRQYPGACYPCAIKQPHIPEPQDVISARNKATRECLAATPLAQLKAKGQFIPVWRTAQGCPIIGPIETLEAIHSQPE